MDVIIGYFLPFFYLSLYLFIYSSFEVQILGINFCPIRSTEIIGLTGANRCISDHRSMIVSVFKIFIVQLSTLRFRAENCYPTTIIREFHPQSGRALLQAIERPKHLPKLFPRPNGLKLLQLLQKQKHA